MVLGHSFGGAAGAVLGTGWFGVEVAQVVAVGVKIRWTPEEEEARARVVASRPALLASREEAVTRHLKLAGLHGLVDPADPVAGAGVRRVDGALDPRAFSALGPSVPVVLSASAAPLRLPAEAADPMVDLPTMPDLDPQAVLVPNAGHNAHWERPEAVLGLIP